MRWMTEFPSAPVIVSLMLLGSVALVVSGATLGVAHRFRRSSAPTREAVLRAGLLVLVMGPLLVVLGAVGRGVREPTKPVHQVTTRASTPLAQPTRSISVTLANQTSGQTDASRTMATHEPLASEPTLPHEELTPVSEDHHTTVMSNASPPPLAEDARDTTVSAAPARIHIPPSLFAVLRIAGLVWFVGVMLQGLSLFRDLLRVAQLRHRLRPCRDETAHEVLTVAVQLTGLRHRPAMYVSDEIGSPCTTGVWSPIVILPSTVSTCHEDDGATLLGVLTHECAHVVRRDVAWSLLARATQTFYWWEPGLRRIVSQLSQLREEICDNHVLSASINPRLYAKALLDFAAVSLFRPLVGVIGMVGKNNPLADRVERLVQDTPDMTKQLGRRSKWAIWLLFVLNGGLFVVIGAELEFPQLLAEITRSEVPQKTLLVAQPVYDEASPPPIASGEAGVVPSESPLTLNMQPTEAGSGTSAESPGLMLDSFPLEAGSGIAPPFPQDPVEQVELPMHRLQTPEDGDLAESRLSIPEERDPGFDRTERDRFTDPAELKSPSHLMLKYAARRFVKGKWEAFTFELEASRLTLNLPPSEAVDPGAAYALNVTIIEGDSFAPKTMRFEGLVAEAPDKADALPPLFEGASEPLPEALDAALPKIDAEAITPPAPETPVTAPEATPPAPPAPPVAAPVVAEPEVRLVHFLAPVPVVAAIEALAKQSGNVKLDMKLEAAIPEAIDLVAPANSSLAPENRHHYRLSLEAVADEAGQFRGIRYWGRDLPEVDGDHGTASFVKALVNWKAHCAETYSFSQPPTYGNLTPNDVLESPSNWATEPQTSPPQLTVDLRVFDNMRYGDVRALVQACETLKLNVNLLSTVTAPIPADLGRVYAPLELTRVYDKKGQPVGQRSMLLTWRAQSNETQIVTDEHWDTVLSQFTNRYRNWTTVLLVKVDPDLSSEALEAFIVRAQRWGIDHIQLQCDTLQLMWTDKLVPLIDPSPLPSAQTLDPVPAYETQADDEFSPVAPGSGAQTFRPADHPPSEGVHFPTRLRTRGSRKPDQEPQNIGAYRSY